MTELHQALYGFWSKFGVDCYLTGHVPENEKGEIVAQYPYITFEVQQPRRFGEIPLTAICWHKAQNGQNVNAQRAELLDRIAAAIPEDGGATLKLTNSRYIWLTRNTATFQSYYDDPEDKSVVGGRTSYIVHLFA